MANDSMTTRTVTYHVDILGKLWMPSCDAAKSETYKRADLERAGWLPSVADNDEQAEMIESYVNTHEGDFSEIVALNITRVERNVEHAYDGDVAITTTKTREIVLRMMSDDEQARWYDCFGSDED